MRRPNGVGRDVELALSPPVNGGTALPAMVTRGIGATPRPPPCASIAARSFGGEIGRSCMRTPIASQTALATAASGGTIGTSPTPLTPKGWRGFGTSTITASIIGRSDATGTR